MAQKETKFKPTLAQERLLEVLLNPDHRLKSVTDICSLAPCTRKVYYAAFKKPEFIDYYMKESKRMISKAYAGIINASIRQALRGDATHAKMLLNMTGDYVDKMAFPDKFGNPQPVGTTINNNPIFLNPLERATRIAFILQKAIENKKKAEENEGKQDNSEKQGS